MPPALAAVISEYRPIGPTVNVVANSTAAGSTRNIVSGIPYTYASATLALERPPLR